MATSQDAVDKLWSLLFSLIIVVVGPGSMFLAAAYLTPALVGPPVDGSRHGAAQIVEFVTLFGGLFVGLLIAARICAFLTKRFVEAATSTRWDQQFQQSIASMPIPLRVAMQFISRLARP